MWHVLTMEQQWEQWDIKMCAHLNACFKKLPLIYSVKNKSHSNLFQLKMFPLTVSNVIPNTLLKNKWAATPKIHLPQVRITMKLSVSLYCRMQDNLGWKQMNVAETTLARILSQHLCICYSVKSGNYALTPWLCLLLWLFIIMMFFFNLVGRL